MHVRPAERKDLGVCGTLDHSYTTDRVWQMDERLDTDTLMVTFRAVRLPRETRVEYPLQGASMLLGWQRRDGFLVAEEDDGRICGYVTLTAHTEHSIAWASDLIVDRPLRRSGIGTALLRAAAQWGRDRYLTRLLVEVQTKNYAAIRFCQSRGLTFCGYNDHYWPSQDIALYFGQSLR